MEVRDIHPTQYGRLCPIHSPEGPNIGLVLHLASYAKIDKYGFITTPFQKVCHFVKNDGKAAINHITLTDVLDAKEKVVVPEKTVITEEIAKKLQKEIKTEDLEVRGFVLNEYEYIDAFQERGKVIAEANSPTDEFGNFKETRISARKEFEATTVYIKEVDYIDVSPKQIMSETTALVPFLEHDDATRALMGTVMMRQGVPLVRPEAPIVGTGMERVIGEGSGYVILAEEDGEVLGVDAKHISLLYASGQRKTYELLTFERSNRDMHIHQRPLVSSGDKIKAGDILADGQAIDNGELALGKNVLIAYMPWEGYNFEDALIMSSRVVENDLYTSVHIYEFIMDVRETKL